MTKSLPYGWTLCRVANIFVIYGGGTPSRSNSSFWNGTIPWFSSGDIKSDIANEATETITEEGLAESSARLCRPGSVLVVVRSGILKHTLPVAILSRRAAINQDIKCFDSGDDVLNRWLALAWLASERTLLSQNREGTTVQSVKSQTLQNFELAIPPFDEQRRIVAKLEKLLDKVDSCEKRLAKIPILLKRFRQAVLAAACSGDLTADWRENQHSLEPVESTIEKIERLRGHSVPEFDTSEDLPIIPDLWKWVSAASVCSQITDGEHIQPPYQATGRPMLSAKHVRDGFVTLEGAGLISEKDFSKALQRCAPADGDILIVSVGATTGRSAIVENLSPFAIVRSVLLLKPLMCSRFLLRWLQTPWCLSWMAQASGASAQPHLYIKDTKRMPVPFPPPIEQQEIVSRVDELFSLADQIEDRYAKAKRYVDDLKHSILAKAFRGELVPQDPNDEPATVLLERIREARARSAIGSPEIKKRAIRGICHTSSRGRDE